MHMLGTKKRRFLSMLAANFFVTATDTDAGKTFVCCGLIQAMHRHQVHAQVLKPVACGHEKGVLNADLTALLTAQQLSSQHVQQLNLYHFKAPLAPWQAALAEGKCVHADHLVQWCHTHMNKNTTTIIEGVGGLMVPLHAHFNVIDWLLALQSIHTLLVVRVKLGGINHMLLSLEKLQQCNITPVCVVLNDADNCGAKMMEYHQQALQAYNPILPSLHITHHATAAAFDKLYQILIPIGDV